MLISSACLLRISVSKTCLKFKLKYPKTVIRTFYDLDKLKKILRMKISSSFFHHFIQDLSRILNQCLTPFETYDPFSQNASHISFLKALNTYWHSSERNS